MNKHNLLLADDDTDDCLFFKEALEDLSVNVDFNTVSNGVELMHFLSTSSNNLPDVLFLDLNMPLKTGIECLSEIKKNDKLKNLSVIIFTTSFDTEVVNLLYEKGAHYFIRKPGEFSNLKKIIYKALNLITQNNIDQPAKDQFILQP